MTVRVLFYPWSAGGGAGYTGRCLAAAGRLDGRFSAAFGPSAVARMVAEGGFQVVGDPQPAGPPDRVPPYLPLANVERVYAVTARYYRSGVLAAHLHRDLAAIEEFRPDLIVTDMQPTAVLAARMRGLPVVSLADTDFLDPAPNAWMPWSEAAPTALLPHPDALGALNRLAVAHGLDPVGSVTELLWGERTVVPSAQLVEPPPAPPSGRAPAVYVGPLSWDPPGPAYRPRRVPGAVSVYVSIGSGGMVGERALRQLLAALDRPGIAVFLSAGFHRPTWTVGDRVEVGGLTGIAGPLDWADLVIDHGGYSTVLAALARGRPQVVLPFMSEQEANGRSFVAGHGAGLVARTTVVDPATGRLTYVNRHGGETGDPVVPAADLALTVEEALADEALAERAGYARQALADASAGADLSAVFAAAVG